MATASRQLTRQGQDRKDDILKQATALFLERGYADTRMVDIANAAGVAKGLCYWYFANKEALLAELILDCQSRLRGAQRDAIRGLETPLERIYAGTVASVRFVAEHHKLYSLFFLSNAGSGIAGEAHRAARAHDHDAAVTIRQGQEDGSIRPEVDAMVLAFANAGIVNTLSFGVAARNLGPDVEDIAHHAAAYVVRALATEPKMADDVIGRRPG